MFKREAFSSGKIQGIAHSHRHTNGKKKHEAICYHISNKAHSKETNENSKLIDKLKKDT